MTGRDVYLFVFDGMADWEAAFAIAGINNPRFQREPGRYRVITVGSTTLPVTTMGGMRILPDISIFEIEINRAAMLILPGGRHWETDECADISRFGAQVPHPRNTGSSHLRCHPGACPRRHAR